MVGRRDKSGEGLKLAFDMANMSIIQGNAQDIAGGNPEDYLTSLFFILPTSRDEIKPGQYRVTHKDAQVIINFLELGDASSDPLLNLGKNFNIGVSEIGIDALPFEAFTDNRGKYPAIAVEIVFPYRLASWLDPEHETGLNMKEDFEEVQIMGPPPSREKIIALSVLNRLFKDPQYEADVRPLTYEDVTVFIETYIKKPNRNPILYKLNALASKDAYKDAVNDYFLGLNRPENLAKETAQYKEKSKIIVNN